MEGRNPRPSHEQAKLSVRIPNLLLRKHVAGIEKTSDVVQPGWSSRTQHLSMASSMRIPHKSYQQRALASGDLGFPQWRKPYQQTPQSRKRCNKPTRKIPPSSHRSYLHTLKPGAKRALNSCPLSLLPYGNGPRRTMAINY